DLEQAWSAYTQAGKGSWRQVEHEPLPFLCLDRDLVQLSVPGQHGRPHCPLSRITQLDLVGDQCAYVHGDGRIRQHWPMVSGERVVLWQRRPSGGTRPDAYEGHTDAETPHHDQRYATKGIHRVLLLPQLQGGWWDPEPPARTVAAEPIWVLD